MNQPVNFELAKLLNKKGFEKKPGACYTLQGDYYTSSNLLNESITGLPKPVFIYAPTTSDVVMWIHEKHGIWLSVDFMSRIKPYNSGFISHLRGTKKYINSDNFIVINNTKAPGYEVFDSPTEAYSAAIEYVLRNLI